MEEDNIVTTVTSAIWSPDNQEEVARLLRCGYRVASCGLPIRRFPTVGWP